MKIITLLPALILALALTSFASAALASNEKVPPFTQADCTNPVLILTLKSQADVDSFPCTAVSGTLQIDPIKAPINSLSPGLDKVTRVDGDLEIRFAKTNAPTNLNGLNNVTHLGSLFIDANISGMPDRLQDITALAGVTSFGPRNCQPISTLGCSTRIYIKSSDITHLPAWSIANSAELKDIVLSDLTLADPTQFNELPVPADRLELRGVAIDTDQPAQFAALQRITAAASKNVELVNIPGIKQLPAMTKVESLDLIALGLADLGDITPAAFAALRLINIIKLPDIDPTELAPVRDIPSIALSDLPGLTGAAPLAGLTGGSFERLTLSRLSGVGTLGDLSAVTSLNALSIRSMAGLTNLDGLQNLTTITERLNIEQNANLQNVDGLSGLASVGLNVDVQANPALQNLDGLRNLTGTLRNLIVYRNGQLTDITGLAEISGISSNVFVGQNAVTECDVLVQSRLNPAPAKANNYFVDPPCSFTAPMLASSASSLDFGSAPIGNTIDRSVTFNNSTGTISTEVNITAVTITGDALGEYSVLSEDCTGGPLTGGSTRNSCTVTVRFAVTQQGVDNAQLNLNYTASENSTPMSFPVTLTAAGTGVAGDQLTPNTNLDFGQVEVGASNTDTITIDNTGGSGTLTVNALTVTGSDFTLVGNNCGNSYPQTIAVGNTCAVSIQFTPSALNARSGQFTMDSDGATSPDNVNLLGSGVEPPAPVPNPTSLSFGDVAAGTSTTQTVTVTNIGALSSLTLGQLSAGGDFSLQSDTCSGATIAAGGNCTVVVEFTPGAVGSASETLDIPGASGFPSASVALTGNGLQPASLTANPTILAFGTQTQLTTLDVTITNIGAAGQDAQIGTALATGSVSPAQYSIVSDNCSSKTLPGQATCQISVSFDPQQDGADTGSLKIPYNNGETLSVALSGRGGQPVDYITPSSLSFGNIEIGNSSPAQTVTVTDNSGIALDIAAVTSSSGPAFTVQNDNCGGTTVNPGGSCTFDVVFNAITRAHEVGTVEVISNSSSSPDQVLVDGYGAKPGEIALSVTNVDFGAVPPGEKQQQPVTVTNSGDLDIAVPPIVLSGDAAFSVESDTCKGVTLAAASSCSFGIAFAPTALGDVSAQVQVNPTINVTGSGATATPAAPVPTLPFMAWGLLVLLMGLLGWARLRSVPKAT